MAIVRTGLDTGISIIADYVKTLPAKPGVYRMLNEKAEVLYVGKARHLARRVTSYTQAQRMPNRLKRMISLTRAMEFVVTRSEVEALLLEANLIKQFMPPYNILLKDDKSYPYILINADHEYPVMIKHRGARTRPGQYYGPFASAGAVNSTVAYLQKAFMLRNCSDEVFKNRTRPCLQYHIKRCTAPCVGKATHDVYREQVEEARTYLAGKNGEVQGRMATLMNEAAANKNYERAAEIRDRIRALTFLRSQQSAITTDIQDADVVALYRDGGGVCVQVFFYRGGNHYGSRAIFPSHTEEQEIGDILSSFLVQFYDNKVPPRTILLSHLASDQDLLSEALSQRADAKVDLLLPQRGPKRDLVEHAQQNAREALERRRAESSSQQKLLDQVGKLFNLPDAPKRIEVYDNSHIQGTNAVGAMIVAGPSGFMRNAYRKFNIKTVEDMRDDYAMHREVLTRRFTRGLKDREEGNELDWPDLVIIDGGAGQLSSVIDAMNELGVRDVPIIAIAKGEDRNAGRETFFVPGQPSFQLPERDPVLFYLQRLRDESHRFVIGAHRTKRAKSITSSPLDEAPGIGAKRKKALLMHFGSARAVSSASLADLRAVSGVSEAVAKTLYDYFHPDKN